MTCQRTPSCSCSGAATRRRPRGVGRASFPAVSATGGVSSASSRSTCAPTSTTPRPCTPTGGSRSCRIPTRPSTWPSRISGSKTVPMTRITSIRTPLALTSIEAYVMGDEDGVKKTPEWAAPICGVPSRTIKALAKEWASKRTTVVIGNGGPGIRGPYATEPARLQNICLAMQGLGKPGVNQAKMIEWGLFDKPDQYAQPKPLRVPYLRAAYTGGHPDETNHPSFIPKTYIPKAILEGECDWYGVESECADRTDQFVHYKYPADGCSKIHMVWTDSPSWITCWNMGNEYVKAMRHPDIEFMFCSASVARERRPAGRHHPAGEHQARRRRHRRRYLQRPVQPALPRAQVRRAAGRVVQRLRDRRASLRSASACCRSTRAARPSPS